jgi:hypothetical protein
VSLRNLPRSLCLVVELNHRVCTEDQLPDAKSCVGGDFRDLSCVSDLALVAE